MRAKRAHYNAVGNLVVFAPLVILVSALRVNEGLTAGAAMVYFFARAAHSGIHILALPVIRTIAFLIGWGCLMVVLGRLPGWL